MKYGVRVPDGLFLAYPALNLESKEFTPSYLLAINDQIIPYSLLKICLNAYIPKDTDPIADFLLSPLKAPDEFLKKLPPVRMIVGDMDPLHDDCWRFADKLRKLNKNVNLIVYKGIPHGFLGYDVPLGMSEVKGAIDESGQIIKELFEM
mmetsp:Transcript_12581/g.10793  ORF Transcript_12581/g.10793 Transcript_12581/m.10793 type:complete len:149 (+) Transcript_12581:1487-1933(+)